MIMTMTVFGAASYSKPFIRDYHVASLLTKTSNDLIEKESFTIIRLGGLIDTNNFQSSNFIY